MRVEGRYISNTGKVREKNEDSLLVNDLLVSGVSMDEAACVQSSEARQIYVVADGMGGHKRGEVASKTVLQVIKKRYQDIRKAGDISRIMLSSKEALNTIARDDGNNYGMGTTVSGILLADKEAFLFNCGDSRVYRLQGGSLEKLTRDHSVVQELFEFGTITEDEMRFHPKKNILTSAVIADLRDSPPDFDVRTLSISADSTFLICTDGLWESVKRQEMEGCFIDQEITLQCLFERAVSAGGRDNISAIVLRVAGL